MKSEFKIVKLLDEYSFLVHKTMYSEINGMFDFLITTASILGFKIKIIEGPSHKDKKELKMIFKIDNESMYSIDLDLDRDILFNIMIYGIEPVDRYLKCYNYGMTNFLESLHIFKNILINRGD